MILRTTRTRITLADVRIVGAEVVNTDESSIMYLTVYCRLM